MQECVTFSVAEAELIGLIACLQVIIHLKQLIESMNLNVKLPMTIKVDNKGGKDLVNNRSIGGRTRHVGVRLNYLRELKEAGIIQVDWIRSEENVADILAKIYWQLFFKNMESHLELDIGIIKRKILRWRVSRIKVR
jgi:hypothetical protein